jgi:hypothetical protein
MALQPLSPEIVQALEGFEQYVPDFLQLMPMFIVTPGNWTQFGGISNIWLSDLAGRRSYFGASRSLEKPAV